MKFTLLEAPGYEFTIERDPDSPRFWEATESSSGGFICHCKTRLGAKIKARAYIARVGLDRFKAAVEFAIQKKAALSLTTKE